MIDSGFANMSSFAGTTAVNAAIGQSARYAAGLRAPAPAAPTSGQAPARLDFTISPAVMRDTNDRILQTLSKASPGQDLAPLRQALDAGTLQAEFARLLGTAGFSATNLADVLTGYLVISWEVVNGEDSRSHAPGYTVVRDRLGASLAASPAVARMTDADKQRAAETMAVLAMLAAVSRDGLSRSGDAGRLQQLQEGVREAALRFGVDLSRLAFTDGGFVPR